MSGRQRDSGATPASTMPEPRFLQPAHIRLRLMHQKRVLLQRAEQFSRATHDALYGDDVSDQSVPTGEAH